MNLAYVSYVDLFVADMDSSFNEMLLSKLWHLNPIVFKLCPGILALDCTVQNLK